MVLHHIDWLIFALTLSILELFLPGTFLIWIGIAGFLTSIIAYLGGDIYLQSVCFTIFCITTIFAGKRVYKSFDTENNLNQKANELIGEELTLLLDIKNKKSRAKVSDSEWTVYCEKELKEGDKAVITEVKGNILHITSL